MIDIIYVGVIYEIKMYGPLQTKYLYIQICTVKGNKYNKIQCFCEGLLIYNKWGVYSRKPFNRQMRYMQTDNKKNICFLSIAN